MRANRRCLLCKNIGHDKRKCPLNIPPQSTSPSTSPPVLSELPSVLTNNFTAFPNSPTSERCLLLPRNSSPRLNLHPQALSAQTITTTIHPIGTPNSIETIDAPLVPLSVQETAITDYGRHRPTRQRLHSFFAKFKFDRSSFFFFSFNPTFQPAYTAQSEALNVPFQFLSHMLLLIGKTIVHPKICQHNTRAVFTFYYTR